uniref:Uncharacterized protein n=1 Tax=Sphaerodactylus townsendi TaxID=933632 RepID=A0ACB8FP27_9SAUR
MSHTHEHAVLAQENTDVVIAHKISENNEAVIRQHVPEDPPQNFVKGNITGKSFSVSWEPPTIVTGKFSYRVELYGPSGRILDNSTKDLKFSFNNLIPFTTYDVFVAAETSAGNVIESVDVDMINDNSLPSFMWNKIQTANELYEGSADNFPTEKPFSPVKFTRISSDDLPVVNGVSELHLVSALTTDTINLSAKQLSYLVKELQPFTQYSVAVSAFTIIGEGPPAILIVRTSEQVPSSVENINYKNISSSSILLYWDIPLNPNGKIIHYTVYAMELDTNKAFQMTTSNNSILITGLRKYTNYKMRVAASTTVGESALSEENDIFVTTPEDEPDSPPQDVETLEVTATEISLRWSPPEKPNGIIAYYEVMAFTHLGHGNQSSTPLFIRTAETGLKIYTDYTVEVSASTSKGEGVRSEPLNILTDEDAPTSPPRLLTVKLLSGVIVKLSWKSPLEPNGIILYYTVYVW